MKEQVLEVFTGFPGLRLTTIAAPAVASQRVAEDSSVSGVEFRLKRSNVLANLDCLPPHAHSRRTPVAAHGPMIHPVEMRRMELACSGLKLSRGNRGQIALEATSEFPTEGGEES